MARRRRAPNFAAMDRVWEIARERAEREQCSTLGLAKTMADSLNFAQVRTLVELLEHETAHEDLLMHLRDRLKELVAERG